MVMSQKVRLNRRIKGGVGRMLEFLKSIFVKKCYFCKGNKGYFTNYEIYGQKQRVCYKCVEYAERRAFPKVN